VSAADAGEFLTEARRHGEHGDQVFHALEEVVARVRAAVEA
jgi:hypothetical protein